MVLYKKLYGDTITTDKDQQEILTPEAIGRHGDILVNVIGFQIINEGKTDIKIQINGGNIVPVMTDTGIDMGSHSDIVVLYILKEQKLLGLVRGGSYAKNIKWNFNR